MIVTAPYGVLFDWDGVVVDSSRMHLLSWKRLAREIGEDLTEEQFKESFGQINRFIIPNLFQWTDDPAEVDRLGKRKEELYREIIREEGLVPLPGVRELIEGLRGAGVPCVIGTSTEKENIRTSLEVMQMEDCFDGVVASEDVANGKPDPEVFLKAAQKAGLPPHQCVVLEDSHHGLQAAQAGGMKCVGVLTTHPKEKLGDPDLFVEGLHELSEEVLSRLFSAS